MGITRASLKKKYQRIYNAKKRSMQKSRRNRSRKGTFKVKLPQMSKTMKTRLIYAHPVGPVLSKTLRTAKTPRSTTRRVGNSAMNMNRAIGTRRSGRVAGNTVQFISLNNVKKPSRVGKSKYNNLYNLFAGMKL